MRTHPYDKLLGRKRKWSPVKPTVGVLKNGAEDTIRRALSARHLELPVGAFITEGLEKTVPDNARKLLEDNVKDEERHDLALGYYADALGTNEKDENEGKLLRDAWIKHPDHTITKALVAASSFYSLCLGLMGMLLCVQYLLILAETNRSMSDQIPLYVLSWVYVLLLLWINLGRPPLTGFFSL
jgi:hypothetical protein